MTMIAGIQHIRDGVEAQAAIAADMGVVGIIGTAPSADSGTFPLNTPVFLLTSDSTTRAALGTTGTIVDALALISANLTSVGAAKVVVVRVASDDDAQTVITNMVGSEANKTGMWAFLEAPSTLGQTPRILIAPGYTAQSQNGLGVVTIADGGNSGTDGTFALAFTGGTGSGGAGTFTVTAGAVTAVTITDPGVYTVAPTLDFSASTGLTGTDITVALEQLANRVCANIGTIADRLKATVIPEGPTSNRTAWLNWRETLPANMRNLHPLRQNAKINGVEKPLSPAIAALYIARDADNGGVPGKSVANRPILGIEGVVPTIAFSITDGNTEGQLDLAENAGIVIRGELGVDGALADSGFVFWGTDTLSADSSFLFAHVVRMRDFIEIMQVKVLRYYLGRFNINSQTLVAIYNTLDAQLSPYRADGYLIDYEIKIPPDQNTAAELRLGDVTITFRAEEPPVLRLIKINSRRMAEALDALVQQVSTAIDGLIQ